MTLLVSAPLLRAQTDRRLAGLARDGHDRAFEAIVERYRRPLLRYLRRLLSEPLAEDVLQATFVRAWQALGAGTEVQDLRAWLYRIAHNQAVNALRIAGEGLPHVPGVPAANPEIEVERREELRATLDEIDALPERQRSAILAVAVADRPHADVAAELGLSDGALRQLLLRARTTLRAAVTAITPYPIVAWLASGQELGAARVAEVAAGAGGAGLTLKAGVAVLATGVVVAGAPGLRDKHVAPVSTHQESSASADRRQAETTSRAGGVTSAVTPAVTTAERAAPKPVARTVPVVRHASARHRGSSSSATRPAKQDEPEQQPAPAQTPAPEQQDEPEHASSGPSPTPGGPEQEDDSEQAAARPVSDDSAPSASAEEAAPVQPQSSTGEGEVGAQPEGSAADGSEGTD